MIELIETFVNYDGLHLKLTRQILAANKLVCHQMTSIGQSWKRRAKVWPLRICQDILIALDTPLYSSTFGKRNLHFCNE